ncbi:MAG: hypothetical protein LUG18_15510 [Candidatus Azobacteroides sp.]|nr:hypothetical protein [Candidatus Azobacteroides sp.]
MESLFFRYIFSTLLLIFTERRSVPVYHIYPLNFYLTTKNTKEEKHDILSASNLFPFLSVTFLRIGKGNYCGSSSSFHSKGNRALFLLSVPSPAISRPFQGKQG